MQRRLLQTNRKMLEPIYVYISSSSTIFAKSMARQERVVKRAFALLVILVVAHFPLVLSFEESEDKGDASGDWSGSGSGSGIGDYEDGSGSGFYEGESDISSGYYEEGSGNGRYDLCNNDYGEAWSANNSAIALIKTFHFFFTLN